MNGVELAVCMFVWIFRSCVPRSRVESSLPMHRRTGDEETGTEFHLYVAPAEWWGWKNGNEQWMILIFIVVVVMNVSCCRVCIIVITRKW